MAWRLRLAHSWMVRLFRGEEPEIRRWREQTGPRNVHCWVLTRCSSSFFPSIAIFLDALLRWISWMNLIPLWLFLLFGAAFPMLSVPRSTSEALRRMKGRKWGKKQTMPMFSLMRRSCQKQQKQICPARKQKKKQKNPRRKEEEKKQWMNEWVNNPSEWVNEWMYKWKDENRNNNGSNSSCLQHTDTERDIYTERKNNTWFICRKYIFVIMRIFFKGILYKKKNKSI